MARNLLIITISAAMLIGCTQLVKEAKDIEQGIYRAEYETLDAWRRLLVYNPPDNTPQLAQRRYCYKQLTDIVCYDAKQPISSPVTGIQEGSPGRLIAGKVAYEEALKREEEAYNQRQFAAGVEHVTISSEISEPLQISTDTGIAAPLIVTPSDIAAPVVTDGHVDNPAHCVPGGPFACGESAHLGKQTEEKSAKTK